MLSFEPGRLEAALWILLVCLSGAAFVIFVISVSFAHNDGLCLLRRDDFSFLFFFFFFSFSFARCILDFVLIC